MYYLNVYTQLVSHSLQNAIVQHCTFGCAFLILHTPAHSARARRVGHIHSLLAPSFIGSPQQRFIANGSRPAFVHLLGLLISNAACAPCIIVILHGRSI